MTLSIDQSFVCNLNKSYYKKNSYSYKILKNLSYIRGENGSFI